MPYTTLRQNHVSGFKIFINPLAERSIVCHILGTFNRLRNLVSPTLHSDLHNKPQRYWITLFVLDAAVPYQLGLQDQASRAMLAIVDFHDDLMFMMHLVFFFVLVLLMRTLVLFSASNGQAREGNVQEPFQDLMGTTGSKNSFIHGLRAICLKCRYHFSHHTRLEVYWTVLPMAILLAISGPSMMLLYSSDELVNPAITIKVIGHQ